MSQRIYLELNDRLCARLKRNADTQGLGLTKYLDRVATLGPTATQSGTKRAPDIRAGDVIGGYIIKTVDYSNENYAIFRTNKNTLGFKIDPAFRFKEEAETAFHKANRRLILELRGAYRNEANVLMASCLDSCLRAQGSADKHFESIGTFIDERRPVKYVYGFETEWAVYKDKHDELRYDYPDRPAKLTAAVVEFNRLLNISRMKLTNGDQKHMHRILGYDLAACFAAGQAYDPNSHFISSRDFVNGKVEGNLRAKYVMWSVVWALALLALTGFATLMFWRGGNISWQLTLGAMGGVLGATISVMQRGSNLTVNPLAPPLQIVFAGLTRIALGMIFGFVLVVAAKANISLGIVKDSMWSLFVFTIVAGLSERFVPDILESIGKN